MASSNLSGSSNDDSSGDELSDPLIHSSGFGRNQDGFFTSQRLSESDEDDLVQERRAFSPSPIRASFSFDSSSDKSSGLKRKKPYEDTAFDELLASDTNKTSFLNDDSLKTKKRKLNEENFGSSLDKPLGYENKGRNMLEKMGFKSGEGLGKHSQGIVDPIKLSNQRGRIGLGASVPELDAALENWKPDLERVEVDEEKVWLENLEEETLDVEVLRSWVEEGPEILEINEMTDFCDREILRGVLNGKNVFDKMDGHEMRKARAKSNPFETIGGGIFLNRAAMKMANIDSAFDNMFTSPVDENDKPMVGKNELLYFADVCAGPGGFSEYILWRKRWRAKGFGFTLKGENDFQLAEFFAGPCETFEPYYGVKDDGNVYDPDNISSLTSFVMRSTDEIGVHFMMADGGFSVDGQENIQEILSKRLYLAQFLVALSIVRTRGHFVCKLFDLFSPFSAGLIYLMYRCFRRICIFKPNTSRPANSERYIICKWKRHDCEGIRQFMFELNQRLWDLSHSSIKPNIDINFCVPLSELKGDHRFYKYLVESNNKLGRQQIVGLTKIAAFYQDQNMIETRQMEMRRLCLHRWKVPDKVRKADRTTPEEACKNIFSQTRSMDKSLLSKSGTPLEQNIDRVKQIFDSVYEWNCIVIGSEEKELNFYMGMGRNKLYRLKGTRWIHESQLGFDLSPGTLVFGEIISEYSSERRRQHKLPALHIIDAIAIGYEFIAEKHYNERLETCLMFEAAIRKRTQTSKPVRVIRSTPLENISHLFESVHEYMSSYHGPRNMVVEVDDICYPARGILFFNPTKLPWRRTISLKTKHCYYHKPHSDSFYEQHRPADAAASVKDCIERMKVWWWVDGVGVKGEKPKPDVLHKDHLISYVQLYLVK